MRTDTFEKNLLDFLKEKLEKEVFFCVLKTNKGVFCINCDTKTLIIYANQKDYYNFRFIFEDRNNKELILDILGNDFKFDKIVIIDVIHLGEANEKIF